MFCGHWLDRTMIVPFVMHASIAMYRMDSQFRSKDPRCTRVRTT